MTFVLIGLVSGQFVVSDSQLLLIVKGERNSQVSTANMVRWGVLGAAVFGNHICMAKLSCPPPETAGISLVSCCFFSFVFQLYDKNGVTMSGVLKRKYEELGDDSTYCSSSSCSPLSSSASSGWDTDEENSHGEPKPSSALMSSFTREYLWLSQDQPFLCMGF